MAINSTPAMTMELDEWLKAIDNIKDSLRKTTEDVDKIMTELGYTEEQQQQLRWIFN